MKPTEPIESRNTDHYDPQQAKDLTPAGTPAGTQEMNATLPSEFDGFDVLSFPSNFFACIFAPRRNGKTTHVLNFCKHFHKHKRFTHYFILSQTLSGYEGFVPFNYQHPSLDHVPEIIARLQKVGKYNKGQERQEDMVRCSVLLVLDDMVGDARELRQQNGIMQKLACNGRHVCKEDPLKSNELCTIIISQRITLIPPPVRMNADIIFASRLASYLERKTLIESYLTLTSDREGMKESKRVFDQITLSKEFRFIAIALYIANRKSYKDYVFYVDSPADPPPFKLFGDESDWQLEKPDIVF